MKYALKLIFLKCIFEFIINTAPPASNSVYGKEKLFWYDKINHSNQVCHCGAVVKELLARADNLGSTPGDAVFCFLYRLFFRVWSLFFNTIFPFGLFFFILIAYPAGHALGSISVYNYINLKGISKTLDLHTGQAYDQIKTINPVKTCPSPETVEFFFNFSWHHDKQHTVHHKLAFCTSP